MPAVPVPLEIILPFLVRLFPALTRAPVLGKIIPLLNVEPTSDELLERALQRQFKRRPNRRINDAVHVVKLDDAIKCVEKVISDGKLQKLGLLKLSKMLLDPRTGGSPIGDAIIGCLRESVLRQDTVRAGTKTIHSPRPARGHGKGRRR